ncbi:MAG: hypothetical protein JNJ70_10760 [Verrucomicrobiales bacterium]|nr:hypothetical protein [Verrucomicrobiales bacterium]
MGFFGRAAVEEEPDERGKVFNWAREKRIWVHLTAFLFFSILIHGSGFYLFKVVYPSPVRVEPEPDGILVMKSDDPATRSVLQRLADRTIFLMPPSAQAEERVRLESHRVRFTPAFQKTELALLPPPSMTSGPGLPQPLPATDPGQGTPVVPVKIDPALAGRPLAPWSILHDYLALAEELPAARLTLEIAPGGEVKVSTVEAALEESEKRDLASVIESILRFQPAPGPATGWIELGGG